jgi:hypothetical protein
MKSSRPKGMLPRSRFRIFGMIKRLDLARPGLIGIIFDHDFQRPQHRHSALRRLVEMLADRRLQHSDVDHAVGFGDADALDEIADRRRRHTAAAQAGKRRHARIVPAARHAAANELGQHPLRQHRVGEIEPRELVLMGPRRYRQVVDQPVIKRTVILELQRADRVGDAFDGVGLAVGEVVARIDAPFHAGARMFGVQGCDRAPDRAG